MQVFLPNIREVQVNYGLGSFPLKSTTMILKYMVLNNLLILVVTTKNQATEENNHLFTLFFLHYQNELYIYNKERELLATIKTPKEFCLDLQFIGNFTIKFDFPETNKLILMHPEFQIKFSKGKLEVQQNE